MRTLKQLTSSIVLVSFGLAPLVHAAGKYTKKEAQISVVQTELTKPKQAKKEDVRPTINASDVFGGLGDQVKQITDEQVKVLRRLIENTDDSDPEKPDLLFRMAELYAEQERYYNFRARDLDQKIFEAGNAGNAALETKLKGQQVDYNNKSKQWLLEAVKKYLEVADHPEKYGTYKRTDQVLFYLAFLLTEVKKEDQARRYFKRLIKDYPKSKFIPDAYLSFGEYFFDNKDIENALKFYDKVLEYPDSRVFGYAKYKEGWCYYNLSDFKQALATFVSVVELTQKGGGSSVKANRLALAKEAKKDVVRAYAQLSDASPDRAWNFFQRVGDTYAQTMLEQLGDLYNAQGQFENSTKVFRQLMTIAPTSPKLCSWQTEVMRNTLSATGSRAASDTVKELQRLAAVYNHITSDKALKKDVIEECHDNTVNTLRELATVWHKEAQKTNNAETYKLAQYLYKEYLAKFPNEKDSYVMAYYYGELLFKLGSMDNNQKYCEAAPIYTKVVEMDPSPTAKYLKDAAYAAVISWKNCLSVEDSAQDLASAQQDKRGGAAKASSDERFAEQKIPERQMKMIEAFDTYIKYVPESKELATIKYRKARIYYEYNHFDQAIPLFREIAEHHKDSDLAIYSANLLIDCLAIKKDFKGVEQAVDVFLASPELTRDADFKSAMSKIKANTIWRHIEELEKAKQYREAATLYVQLATDYPDHPRIDEIYYNAAIDFERANLVGLAIKQRQMLLKAKPDTALAKKAIYLIGRNFQSIAAYDQAAENYENFASRFGAEKDAPDALFLASFFRQGLANYDKAIEDTKLFTSSYGSKKEFVDRAAGMNLYEYQIYEQQKDRARLQKHFTEYLKTWGKKGGTDREIIANVKLGELLWAESCPVAGVNGACIEVTRTRSGSASRVEEGHNKGHKRRHGANLPAQCGPATKSKITVFERKPKLVAEAMVHFNEAIKLFKGGAADKHVAGKDEQERANRTAEMNFYAAEARMLQGDLEYEKFLNMKIPDKLDFSPAPAGASPKRVAEAKKRLEASQKKFKGWLDTKTKQLQLAQKIYQNVILYKQANWAIAASARIGLLFQDYSGQLYTAPVPKSGAAPPGIDPAEFEQLFHDAYCDAMTDQAEPLEAKAIEGLGTCLKKSTDLSWFNEWSALCERELNQIKPLEYPLAAEIRAEPGYSSVSVDRSDVQSLEDR